MASSRGFCWRHRISFWLPLPALPAADTPKPSKPNVIVIYTDDHGYADLGCQGIMKDVKTPNIDALATGGVRMTSGYVTAPQCSPSRCGLISGQYQNKFGMEDNGSWKDDPNLLPRFYTLNNLPKRMKSAGYVTGMAGKSLFTATHKRAMWWSEGKVKRDKLGRIPVLLAWA